MNEVHSPKKPLIFYYMVAMLLVMLFNFIAMPWLSQYQIQEVDYNTFVSMTEKGEIGRAEIQEADNRILFTSKDEKNIYKTAMISTDSQLVQRLLDAGVSTSGEEIEQTSLLMNILSWVAPILIFIALGQFMSRKLMQKMGGGNSMMFNMGKSNAKVYVKSAEGIRFDDVAGEDEAKENLTEIVNYLHDPSKYQEIGASMPKGVLLVGPPGTGKTMLAKAVAGEANVPFFSMSGSEFVEMFVGMGASKVRDLFKQAKEKAPCIVFIDEIDAIGKKRDGQIGGNDEREQTLNQLLTEMDGFEGNTGVIILAATNRPESLDPALTRPGRFDRRVPVELPDLKGREEILKVHAKKIKVAEDVDFNKVARMASGASGAELANIVNEAALRAVRDGRKFATQADLEESIEVVIAGYQKKNAIMTDHEKRIVAYHEIGHALVAAMQNNSAPVQKITIIPRTSGALGYTMQVEQGDKYLLTKQEIEDKIAAYTGGRAAEEIVFNEITTGASNDIEQATKLARAMITRYGMSETFDMTAMETVNNQYLGSDASLICSNDMQKEIDRLINSYRSNALNKEEAGMLAGWLEESDENRTYFRECLARRELPASAKAEREWARFAARNKILFAVPEVAGRRRSRFLRYVAAAAVVAAGVCAVWFWQRTPDVASEAGAGAEISAAQPLEYRTACGERLDIVLPDGSKVCMNSEATLTVDPGFGKATREIEFDGEAFFTISPDKNCPFIIHSANNNYTVLGTSFNLQSYARENFAVVTLHTGCLQAQARKDVIILDPLDTAIVFWIAASALSFILALFVSKKSHA